MARGRAWRYIISSAYLAEKEASVGKLSWLSENFGKVADCPSLEAGYAKAKKVSVPSQVSNDH